MRIGYPCINRSLDCIASSTFRLDSYSEEKLKETVEGNLDCLERMIEYNIENEMFFLRITSDLIPFASHDVCDFDWQDHFSKRFREIGEKFMDHNFRVTMHPGQYTVLNSEKEDVFRRSLEDLKYHRDVLDAMKLGPSSKINIHVGGVYGNKQKSKERFVERYRELDERIKRRLVIENDEKSYTVQDCLDVHEKTGVPVTLDNLHHSINNSGISLQEAMDLVSGTWNKEDDIPIVHYSSQLRDESSGRHAEEIDIDDFLDFFEKTKQHDFDLILEIKDKEKSVLRIIDILREDSRFQHVD